MKRFIICAGLIFVIFSNSNARIINIPDDYGTIQEGIDASSDGDTVLVQPDTYYENINFNDHNITLGSLFLTTGDEGYISSTIIDGNDLDRVVTQSGPSMLKGFTIQNGLSDAGSGIRCYNGAKIYNNIIKHNFADGEDFTEKGAGIFCSGYAEIIDNMITNNGSNYHAGGIYCLGGSTLIEGNTISNNTGPYACGGIYCRGSDATIRNNLILNNWSEEGPGGGIYCNESNPTIESNIICHNESWEGGGGIYCWNSEPLIIQNVIYDNISPCCGAGICFNRSNGSLINTIVWENYASPSDSQIVLWDSSPDIRYCDIEGGWEGEGNIDEDPQFVEPYIYNFNVYSSSPCIDTGDPAITDPDSTRSDIGLYFSFHPDYPPSGSAWYVSTTGNDTTGDGSPENPYRTIQFAVDTSYIRDTIIVENGVYEENVLLVNKSLVLASRYIFTEDSSDIENTIIDGRGISSVVYSEHCDASSKLMGFTIRNGSSSGIICNLSYITISNNIITNNSADEYGGGIYCYGYDTKPTIIANVIKENYSEAGGGIACNYVIPLISNNNVFNNMATEAGGGILLRNSSYLSDITGNYISNNTAAWGGGIRIKDSAVQVIGNLISNNNARRHGGGVYCGGNRSARFYDNTIVENRAEKGGGIVLATDLYLYLRNCIIWENRTLLNEENNLWWYSGIDLFVTYCDIEDSVWSGEGNICADPLFCHPDTGNYLLAEISPCVGTGFEGTDIGALGIGCEEPTDIIDDLVELPLVFFLSQNYPNPFNPVTTIGYALPYQSQVSLEIYNLLGQRVETLVNNIQKPGDHAINWNASGFSSGIYFYRLSTGDKTITKRMTLLK